jgi:hypothetical protein
MDQKQVHPQNLTSLPLVLHKFINQLIKLKLIPPPPECMHSLINYVTTKLIHLNNKNIKICQGIYKKEEEKEEKQ